MSVRARSLALILVATPLAACASGGNQVFDDSAYGAMTPEMAVTGFLDAARTDEYRQMANLFGTADGPAERSMGRAEVEQRMFVLASILEHSGYELRRLNLTEEPGRARVFADMQGTRSGNVTVPFLTARNEGRWFVEQIETRPLTER